jgi:hypothetical protein
VVRNVQKPLALEPNNVPTIEPLVTPDHVERVKKQNTFHYRQAVTATRKRQEVVAIDSSDNGVSAFSAELQAKTKSAAQPVTPELDHGSPLDSPPVIQDPRPKRRRLNKVTLSMVPPTVSVPTGPPLIKCQGCIHGDLLEVKVMEPPHIKHYLRQAGFLELAVCAGECDHTIQAIHLAAPKANLYYCDEAIKGFSAPDDDPGKLGMECGLILCSPCHAIRETRYAQEPTKEGTVRKRTSRRGRTR